MFPKASPLLVHSRAKPEQTDGPPVHNSFSAVLCVVTGEDTTAFITCG